MISPTTLRAHYIDCTLVCANPYQTSLEKEFRHKLSNTSLKLNIWTAFKFSTLSPNNDEDACWMVSF